MMSFRNRSEAGRLLALKLSQYSDLSDLLILALPRGGVPVGYELAHALHAPLDVLIVRKLGLPGHEELAMGAIATGGISLLNREIISAMGVKPEAIAEVEQREGEELKRRERMYSGKRPPIDVTKKIVILVDDGIATGSTMQAAIASLRQRGVKKIVVATPVAPFSTLEMLHAIADKVVCVMTPEDFGGVGRWYDDFSQTSDEEVQYLLEKSASEASLLQPPDFHSS